MCRPPRIAVNADERTARRSVPATFVGVSVGIRQDCSYHVRNVQRSGRSGNLENLFSIFGLCADQNLDAPPTGHDD